MHLGALPGGAFGSSKPRFRVEVVLVRNRLVIPAVSGFPVVGLGVWVFDLLVRAVDQKPSPCEVGGETERSQQFFTSMHFIFPEGDRPSLGFRGFVEGTFVTCGS